MLNRIYHELFLLPEIIPNTIKTIPTPNPRIVSWIFSRVFLTPSPSISHYIILHSLSIHRRSMWWALFENCMECSSPLHLLPHPSIHPHTWRSILPITTPRHSHESFFILTLMTCNSLPTYYLRVAAGRPVMNRTWILPTSDDWEFLWILFWIFS